MLRSWIALALLAIVFAVGSSDAVDCTSSKFKDDLEAAKKLASNTILALYASATHQEIVDAVLAKTKDTIVSFDYTETVKGDTISFDYKIVSACDHTTTTVVSDESSKSTSNTKTTSTKETGTKTSSSLLLTRKRTNFYIIASVHFSVEHRC